MSRNSQFSKMILLALIALFAVGCGSQIDSGHRGVFFSRFGGGTEVGKVYGEGFVWHLPWNSMYTYKVQLQENKENLVVLSSDGASIRMEVSILYRPVLNKVDSLQVTIGPNYYQVSISPILRGVARGVAGNYKPEEIYSTKREEMQQALIDGLREATIDKFISIENVVLRAVILPPKISEAIDFKLAAAQEAERMQFTIEKERKEAERKSIEAKGIADFQKIVSAGITSSLLKWKGIEATLKIAESNNAKIIIVGNDAGSLPVILSADGK